MFSTCMFDVSVSSIRTLLDTSIPDDEKLYGYHRLDDPLVVIKDEKGILIAKKRSQVMGLMAGGTPCLLYCLTAGIKN